MNRLLLSLVLPSLLFSIPAWAGGAQPVPTGGVPSYRSTGTKPKILESTAAVLIEARESRPKVALRAPAEVDTFRLLAIMIEFPADSDGATTGDGLFGSVPDASEIIWEDTLTAPGLAADGDSLRVPHDARYFRAQLGYVSQYYRKVSYGHLIIEPTVLDSIFQAPEPMAYYGENDSIGIRQPRLVAAAIEQSDPLVDFSLFDGIAVIHAGCGEETDVGFNSPGDLWTTFYSRSDFEDALADSSELGSYDGIPTDDLAADGRPFSITETILLPESETQDGLAQWILGVSAHMMGRLLGAPSLFDPTPGNFPDSQGIGNFGIMGTGLWNSGGILPPHPTAWTKIHFGWIEPLTITRDTTIELHQVESGDDVERIIRVPITETEYFLIENRFADENGDGLFTFDDADGDGRFDTYADSYREAEFDWSQVDTLPVSGLLIWHIDEEKIAEGGDKNFRERNRVNADRDRKGVDLEEAGDLQDLDLRARSLDNFGTHFDSWYVGNRAIAGDVVFGPGTTPNTRSNFGAYTGITIEVLSPPGETMTMSVKFREPVPGWPVSVPPGQRIVGPVVPVRSDAIDGTWFAYSTYDSALDQSYGNLIGLDGEPAEGWPFQSPVKGEVVFAPVEVFILKPLLLFPLAFGGIYAKALDLGDPTEIFSLTTRPAPGRHLVSLSGENRLTLFSVDDSTFAVIVPPVTTPHADGFHSEILPGTATGPGTGSSPVVVATDAPALYVLNPEGGAPLQTIALSDVPTPVVGGIPPGDDELTGLFQGEGFAVLAGKELVLAMPGSGGTYDILPVALESRSAGYPAVADLNRNGHGAVLFGTEDGKIHAYHSTGARQIDWPVTLRSGLVSSPFDVLSGAPAVGDLDGDGEQEVALVTTHGALYLLDSKGQVENGFPVSVGAVGKYGVQIGMTADKDTTFLLTSSKSEINLFVWPVDREPVIQWHGYQNGFGFTGWLESSPFEIPSGEPLLIEPEVFAYPNPSREPETIIHYRVTEAALLRITIFDMAGGAVADLGDRAVPAETGEIVWDTSDLASGVYFARIEAIAGGRTEHSIITIAIVR